MSIIRKLRVALADHENAHGRMPARINAGRALIEELDELCTRPVEPGTSLPAGAHADFCGVLVYRGLVDEFELVVDDPLVALQERMLEALAKRPGGAN